VLRLFTFLICLEPNAARPVRARSTSVRAYRRGRGHDGRAGAPGGGNRDGGRLGGGDEPRGHDEEARQGRQRPPERGRRAGRV
jgi:hypothetical protein